MARVPNIKIGKGSLKVGHSILQNQNKSWNNTGDGFTYKDLSDRPDYYLNKFSKKFNVGFTKYEAQKVSPLLIREPKDVFNPNNEGHTPSYSYEELKIQKHLYGKLTGTISNPEYFDQYIDNSYKLAYYDPHAAAERISRPVKYDYTCEEIQAIIEEDLVSGISGYDVSSAGTIQFPQYGPYLIQARSTGLHSGVYIKPGTQTDPEFISGSVEGYDGDVNDYSTHVLRHYKTGTGMFEITVDLEETRDDIYARAGVTLGIYDFSVGTYVNRGLPFDIITGFNNLHDGKQTLSKTAKIHDVPNCLVLPNKVFKLHLWQDIYVDFNQPLDPEDTDKVIYATGARPINRQAVRKIHSLFPDNTVARNLDVGPNQYTKDDYFAYGAPSGFCGHRYHKFKSVKIDQNPELKSFRIPIFNHGSINTTLKEIEVTDCSNLDYFYSHPKTFSKLEKLNFSGCNLDFANDYHIWHTGQSNVTYGKFGPGPTGLNINYRNLRKEVPDYARYDLYNGRVLDTKIDELVPPQCAPFFNAGLRLNHVNLAKNNLNQTGVYQIISTLVYLGGTNGYLNVKDQSNLRTPERAVFTERADAYQGHYWNGVEMGDINNKVLTGIIILKNRGWEIHYDGSLPY